MPAEVDGAPRRVERPLLTESRKFSLGDAMILVGALAIAMGWVAAYWRSMAAFGGALGRGASVGFTIPIRYFGVLGPFLVTSTLATFGMRLLRPHPSWRRLARLPGFMVGAAVLLGLFITLVTVLTNELSRPLGRVRTSLYLVFLTMRTINYTAPVIAGVWLALGMSGCWHRRLARDWLERFAIFLGICWLCLAVAMQVNL